MSTVATFVISQRHRRRRCKQSQAATRTDSDDGQMWNAISEDTHLNVIKRYRLVLEVVVASVEEAEATAFANESESSWVERDDL